MTQQLEAMKQALEFIDANADGADERDIALALRQAIEEAQKQEPHGWYIDGYGAVIGTAEPKSVRVGEWLPWYTSPPQRQWVGLTDEEVKHQWEVWRANAPRYVGFAKGIEAKLKEKNT